MFKRRLYQAKYNEVNMIAQQKRELIFIKNAKQPVRDFIEMRN